MLEPGEDPEVLGENAFRALDKWDQYRDYVAESQLGGSLDEWLRKNFKVR